MAETKKRPPKTTAKQTNKKNLGLGIRLGLVSHFPGGSEVKASAFNAGDPGLIPGLGRSPGEGRKESDTTERLHFHQVLARESQLGNLGQVP